MSILLRVKAARTIATLSQGRSATLSQVESTVNLRSERGSAESLLWGGTARHPAEAGCLQDACKAPLQPWPQATRSKHRLRRRRTFDGWRRSMPANQALPRCLLPSIITRFSVGLSNIGAYTDATFERL